MVLGAEEDASQREQWPAAYCQHSERELLLLSCTEDFRRRHNELRPTRRPLLLVPRNECGLPKMVCTTLRPTGFCQPELFLSWEGAAKFVADHVRYQPLENPVFLPEQLRSPASILQTQQAHSFELSVLLASVLIGAWYDAYVVSGYACKQLCDADLGAEDFPPWPEELLSESETETKEEDEEKSKYQVKLEFVFESQYLLGRELKEQQRIEELERNKREEEERALEESKRPPPDELHGLRTHSWVLVRAGPRDVEQPFFVEPSTGCSYSVDDEHYLGVESVWNHDNYWVSLKGPTEPLLAEDYQLEDRRLWEALRPGDDYKVLPTDSTFQFLLLSQQLEMPQSWSEPLVLTPSAYEGRFPEGSSTLLYKNASLQRWAPYLRPDGLVAELTRYADDARQEPVWVLRRYSHREDMLQHSKTYAPSGSVTDTFLRGRSYFLMGHSYVEGQGQLEDERTMTFSPDVHLDNLREVRLGPCDMWELFQDREDRLYERHATFSPASEDQPRSVVSVTEKFSRDEGKPAVKDIAEKLFAISQNTITVTYHVPEDNFTANWRTFKKPSGFMFGERFRFEPQMTRGYQANPRDPPPRMLHLFRLFEQLLAAEDFALMLLRRRQDEVVRILQSREREFTSHELKISCFDVGRNAEAREAVKLQERQLAELKHQEQAEMVYEELFLPEPSDPVSTLRDSQKMVARLMVRPRVDMLKLYLPDPDPGPMEVLTAFQSCVTDFKLLLQRREKTLEARLRKASDELHNQQEVFEAQREQLSAREVEDTLEHLEAESFHVHCLDLLLRRHRQLAPSRFSALQDRLEATVLQEMSKQ